MGSRIGIVVDADASVDGTCWSFDDAVLCPAVVLVASLETLKSDSCGRCEFGWEDRIGDSSF